MANVRLEHDPSVRLVAVADCRGSCWGLDVESRTIYYLASLSTADVAQAVIEGLQALAAHDARPRLRLVRPLRDAVERATG